MTTTSWSGTRRAFPASTRRHILERDGYRCQRCGHHDPTGRTLVADHIIPAAEGGTDEASNGAAMCDFGPSRPSCHQQKTREEQARARARTPKRQRPIERHPGLL